MTNDFQDVIQLIIQPRHVRVYIIACTDTEDFYQTVRPHSLIKAFRVYWNNFWTLRNLSIKKQ